VLPSSLPPWVLKPGCMVRLGRLETMPPRRSCPPLGALRAPSAALQPFSPSALQPFSPSIQPFSPGSPSESSLNVKVIAAGVSSLLHDGLQ
jgi:hypothetical protein